MEFREAASFLISIPRPLPFSTAYQTFCQHHLFQTFRFIPHSGTAEDDPRICRHGSRSWLVILLQLLVHTTCLKNSRNFSWTVPIMRWIIRCKFRIFLPFQGEETYSNSVCWDTGTSRMPFRRQLASESSAQPIRDSKRITGSPSVFEATWDVEASSNIHFLKVKWGKVFNWRLHMQDNHPKSLKEWVQWKIICLHLT